jgi:hypothetical protein
VITGLFFLFPGPFLTHGTRNGSNNVDDTNLFAGTMMSQNDRSTLKYHFELFVESPPLDSGRNFPENCRKWRHVTPFGRPYTPEPPADRFDPLTHTICGRNMSAKLQGCDRAEALFIRGS